MQALINNLVIVWYRDVLHTPEHRGLRRFMFFGTDLVLVAAPAAWTAVHAKRTHMPKPLSGGYKIFMQLVRPCHDPRVVQPCCCEC